MKKAFSYIAIALALLVLVNCNPERSYILDNDATLTFSSDTVLFDTVFTTVGTATRVFMAYNPHNRFIKIDDINLAGGNQSPFRLNVDGAPGIDFTDYEIAPGDSMYIFVEATLDPNNMNNILRIQDSIVFSVNGNIQDVDLVAWGQDVHMIKDSILDYSTTWVADKPYLIINYLAVDTLQTLTIEEGVEIYMHRDAFFYVLGTLQIQGSLDNPVIIQGDRLEPEYQDQPGYGGQWYGIYFAPGSMDNIVDHAVIWNGTIGLQSDSTVTPDRPALIVSNTEINRMSYSGIVGLGSSIEAYNTVVGDCGNSSVLLLLEGNYSFNHCTLANFWPDWQSKRKRAALRIENYIYGVDSSGTVFVAAHRDMEKASFTNSIIYGSRKNEITVSQHPDNEMNYYFDYVLTRLDREEYDYFADGKFNHIINDKNPSFVSEPESYELDSISPAINAGKLDYAINFPYSIDKNGNSRLSDGVPDLGAFERK